MAYLSMVVTNLVRAVHGKEDDKLSIPMDFMPNWGKGEDEVKETGQSQEEMRQIMMGIARASRKRKPQNKDIQKRALTKTRKR